MISSVSGLRGAFLDYFNSKGHKVISSSPLVAANDPSLLFVNAGMVQFKDTFLGVEQRHYSRATSCQRCVRAGGKHNDLENVGYTARHHTFFEMLGNFSFGDYFKRDAIEYAWEFLTEVLKLPPEKLWVTVYEQDDEAADIWLKDLKVDPSRFSRCGEKDNFWSMGDTGPCGPCSEIFYDHGSEVAGGPPGSVDEDGDRYIEIWNLVFMQYNRDSKGNLSPLPKPSVDTGMGLERLAAVMQGVHSNYEIDLFDNLIRAVARLAACDDLGNKSLRVIADHIRACAFLIVDGVVPSNEGRGYVLRRIIRRAIRHGHQLGLREPFFYRLVEPLSAAYSELAKNRALVERILKQEEQRFDETLDRGMVLLDQAIADLSGDIIPGYLVFKLYDTYGFPTDLTADIARERNLELDMAGFELAMAEQRARSGAASKFEVVDTSQHIDCKSEFTGYDQLVDESVVTGLFDKGEHVHVVLEHTPFYAESGGQVGDKGVLVEGDTVFEVLDTKKMGQAYVHIGVLRSGDIKVGDKLAAQVDANARKDTARNHSATHLLHAALQQILGDHVKQKGSLVNPDRLRFDFSHFEPVSSEQLKAIEALVNEQILAGNLVKTRLMSLEDAMQSGAMALFGEKYDEQVRVLSIGDFSTELCGGTHVGHVGEIGLFKVVSETGVAAGVRRIEAVTANRALDWIAESENKLQENIGLLKTKNRSLEKEISRLQAKLASQQGSNLVDQAVDVNGIKVLAANLENVNAKQLRETLDQVKSKFDKAAIVLASVNDNKISLVAGVTKNITDKIKAGDLLKHVATQVDGKGGGRADMAQGGGNNPAKLSEALDSVFLWVRK